MHLKHRQTCRVCGCGLKPVIDLGRQHLQGSFVKDGAPAPPTRQIPCTLVRCDTQANERACGLLQMQDSVPPAILYDTYWYRSGTNTTMRNHLDRIAREAVGMIQCAKKKKLAVLDIGCNDGTLLSFFPKKWRRVGIDPSDAAGADADFETVRDTFPSEALMKASARAEFDIITSIAMFYDVEDPVAFAAAIQQSLSANGVWILEVSYMPAMLEHNSYDTICHEHLEYYSLSVLENIASRAGLRIFHATLNESNGGSIRCYVCHASQTKTTPFYEKSLREIRWREFDLQLDTDEPYSAFQNRIEGQKYQLKRFLEGLRKDGKRVHGYGASTKGNTILQWCGICTDLIDCIADRNPEKHGARTLGTNIPIVSEAESRDLRPDYYLVLPWHFRTEFVARERAALTAGAIFIFPLPEIEIYGAEFGSRKV